MNALSSKFNSLNGNMLKILALITMTIDHIGLILLDNYQPFRIIGRIAFPIFAYMIAEGCKYTKNKKKYFLLIFLLSISYQVVYYLFTQNFYLNILVTFSFSILLIYMLKNAREKKNYIMYPIITIAIIGIVIISAYLPVIWSDINFGIDYGFFGIMLPVIISLSDNKYIKLLLTTIGLIFVCWSLGGNQWYSLLSLIPLALYNGERGKYKMKYLFYVYYPLHLIILYSLNLILK